MKTTLYILLFCFLAPLNWSQTSGTITVKKKKTTLDGLYERTRVLVNKNVSNPGKLGAGNEPFYFYFFPNGKVYQIQSKEKPEKIEALIESNPAKLRPILADYQIVDSVLIITPIAGGIGGGMEPSKAFYEGKFNGDELLVSDRYGRTINVFQPLFKKPEDE